MSKALIVIDAQNDYFPGGLFPLWNAEGALQQMEDAIARARAAGIPVVLVQHLADPALGTAPFFNRGTAGAELHPRVRAAAPEARVVEKAFADSFEKTALAAVLEPHGVDQLLLCGMMTQNCVTHTALSRAADHYDITVLSDACTTVSEILHLIALHALSPRVRLTPVAVALAPATAA